MDTGVTLSMLGDIFDDKWKALDIPMAPPICAGDICSFAFRFLPHHGQSSAFPESFANWLPSRFSAGETIGKETPGWADSLSPPVFLSPPVSLCSRSICQWPAFLDVDSPRCLLSGHLLFVIQPTGRKSCLSSPAGCMALPLSLIVYMAFFVLGSLIRFLLC